ncbi:MAG TPA: tyrosine-type recombinase/integrase [Microlunatus sp.]|nr:tyrosine-type recombinase/integrase [Microlunatus sp.]
MRGSVVKRVNAKGRAAYYVVVDEVDSGTGKRRRRWHTDPASGQAFTTRKAADQYNNGVVASVHSGQYVSPNKIAVAEYLAAWLQAIKPTIKLSTWASYEKNVRLHVIPHLGRVELAHLTALHLDRLYAHLLTKGRQDGTGGLSARTVKYVHTIVGRALKDAARKGLVVRSVARDADPPKSSTTRADVMRTWTGEETGRFLHLVAEHRFGSLFVFLASTGCRRGEALGLRWRDVNLDGDQPRASIRQTVTKVAGQTLIGTTKTNQGRRVLVLDQQLVDDLKVHRRRQAEQRLLLGAGWRDNDLVFPNHIGDPQAPETVSRVFRELVDKAGLPPIRLHDLRHGWATLALEAGIHPKVVQERLGHANIAITLGTYSHVAPTMHESAAATVAGMIRGN